MAGQVSAELGSLRRADGSATFSVNGYSVIAGVNGPVEVQRRDELPEEAALEIDLRPAVGVPGVRERHFESIIQKALRYIITVDAHPRTLIQVTLQIVSTPEDDFTTGRPPQAASNLSVLPPLLNAAILALLSTSIPLESTLASTIVAVLPDNSIVPNPSPHAIRRASSTHVFAFTANGHLLVVESDGRFDVKQWQEVAKIARHVCVGQSMNEAGRGGDSIMQEAETGLGSTLRLAVQSKFAQHGKWRKAIK